MCKEERGVIQEEMTELDECDTEKFGTRDSEKIDNYPFHINRR